MVINKMEIITRSLAFILLQEKFNFSSDVKKISQRLVNNNSLVVTGPHCR